MSSRVLVEEINDSLLGTATAVVDRLGSALREPFKSRVSSDAITLGRGLTVGGVGVDLDDDDVGFAFEVCGDGLIGWSKSFAVTAPGLEGVSQVAKCSLLRGESLQRRTPPIRSSLGLIRSYRNLRL